MVSQDTQDVQISYYLRQALNFGTVVADWSDSKKSVRSHLTDLYPLSSLDGLLDTKTGPKVL